jgi:iron complex transport system substrate-binding protein
MGTFWQPNIEAVVAARPDLVIALGFNQQAGLAHRLARLNFNTLTVDIETIPQLFDAIEKIGTVTYKTADAHRLSERLRNNLDNISRRVADGHRPKVLYIIQIEPLRVAGRQTFINELIELAGGENAIAPTINKYPPVGPEQVIASNPDVIIQPVMDVMEKADLTAGKQQLIEYFDRFQSITAVSSNRIYVIDGDAVSRLGPRIDQAAETIARCLRPELFKEP